MKPNSNSWVFDSYMNHTHVGSIDGYTNLAEHPLPTETGFYQSFSWKRYDKIILITALSSNQYETISIPEKINGYRVAGIDAMAFTENSSLKLVQIPSTIEYIGGMAIGFEGRTIFCLEQEIQAEIDGPFTRNFPTSTFMDLEYFFHHKPLVTIVAPQGSIAEEYALWHRLPFLDEQEYAASEDLFKKAIVQGDSGAMFNLAENYKKRTDIAENHKNAISWYEKAAKAGSIQALLALDTIYGNLDQKKRDTDIMLLLGNLHTAGNVVAQDYNKAMYWYEQIAAHNSDAKIKLGDMYKYGNGIVQDYDQAKSWYEKAVLAGYSKAVLPLAAIYNETGSGNPTIMLLLGYLYAGSNTMTKNERRLLLMCDQFPRSIISNIHVWRQVLYTLNSEIVPDYSKAIYWYEKAADAENTDAMLNLAEAYQDGILTSKDDDKALFWYIKAIESGNADAMLKLAAAYQDTNFTYKDDDKAFYWYQKAADAGNADAMLKLAEAYQNGTFISKDEDKAFYWYQKAADAGNDHAAAWIQKIRNSNQAKTASSYSKPVGSSSATSFSKPIGSSSASEVAFSFDNTANSNQATSLYTSSNRKKKMQLPPVLKFLFRFVCLIYGVCFIIIALDHFLSFVLFAPQSATPTNAQRYQSADALIESLASGTYKELEFEIRDKDSPYEVKGYQRMQIAIDLDENNHIISFKVVEHAEHPAFGGNLIKNGFDSLIGQHIASAQIDTVAGVTLTSNAINKALKAAADSIER